LGLTQGEITLLLGEWKTGDPAVLERLIPLVYPRLRQIAIARLRRESTTDVLEPTALVHELYLRLLSQRKAEWKDRAHFFTFSSKMMRLILIDQARSIQAQRRGAKAEHIPLSDDIPWINCEGPEMIDLDRALDELGEKEPRIVQFLELRYFLGATTAEIADIVQTSEATVKRDLRFAKAWIFRRIGPTDVQNPHE